MASTTDGTVNCVKDVTDGSAVSDIVPPSAGGDSHSTVPLPHGGGGRRSVRLGAGRSLPPPPGQGGAAGGAAGSGRGRRERQAITVEVGVAQLGRRQQLRHRGHHHVVVHGG